MSDAIKPFAGLPASQQAIRDKCFHPWGTFVQFPPADVETSIPSRFEKIVKTHPHRIAVKTKTQAVSYLELNRAVNRIAARILEKGEGRGKPILVILNKDAEFVAALLGILRSGNICVPVESSFPRERLLELQRHCQADLIVTNHEWFSAASELSTDASLIIDVNDSADKSAYGNPELSISPASLAFISYTSGSTGKPKGISRSHSHVLHNTRSNTNVLHICPEDKWIGLRPASTAGSINDIFNIILNGGTSYPFEIEEQGVSSLVAWIQEEGITVFSSVIALYRQFVALLKDQTLPHLRLLSLGGEPINESDLEPYKKYFHDSCIFLNRMGSSETGTVSYFFLDKNSVLAGKFVPVGYPANDIEICLTDENGGEVAPNQIGEIAVRSRYLPSGYWRDTELTRAKFLRTKAGADERLYVTSDLGKLSNGCLEFLGRKDNRVRFNGRRIEIAEIERALLEIDSVKAAVVVLREDASHDHSLAAYLVPKDRTPCRVSRLRAVLKAKLPRYMIPSTFTFLASMPLRWNGKIDRKALPEPVRSRPDLDTPMTELETAVERRLAVIWTEILSLDQVGADDNFFDLGGHSLAAMRVVAKVIQAFQVELPLKALFGAPTVTEMAAVIEQHRTKQANDETLSRMLNEIEAMTEAEVVKALAGESAQVLS